MYRYTWIACLLICLNTSSLWADTNPPRTVTAIGYGMVKVQPDIVFIRLYTMGSGLLPSDALTESQMKMEKVQKALKANHREITKIEVETLSLSSGDSSMMESQSSPVAIHVVTLTLPVRGSNLNAILDTGARAGALISPPHRNWSFQNMIDVVIYGLKDHHIALSKANALALEDARAQARHLVEAAGLQLGAPVGLQTSTLPNNFNVTSFWGMREKEQARLFYPVKYFSTSAEEISVHASIVVNFALEQP